MGAGIVGQLDHDRDARLGRKMLVPRDLREMGFSEKRNRKKRENPLPIRVKCAEVPALAAPTALHSPGCAVYPALPFSLSSGLRSVTGSEEGRAVARARKWT